MSILIQVPYSEEQVSERDVNFSKMKKEFDEGIVHQEKSNNYVSPNRLLVQHMKETKMINETILVVNQMVSLICSTAPRDGTFFTEQIILNR